MVLFQFDLWEFNFCLHQDLNWETLSSPAVYHIVITTSSFNIWQFQIFNSGAEGLVVILFWFELWEILFFLHQELNLQTLDVKTCTLQLSHGNFWFYLWKLEVLISCSKGLVVVLFWLDLCECFIYSALGFELEISVSQVLYSSTVPKWFLGFTFWHFQVFNSGEEEFVLVLFWLGHWEFCFCLHMDFSWGPLDL